MHQQSPRGSMLRHKKIGARMEC